MNSTTGAATNAPLNTFIAAFESQILSPIITLLALGAFVFFVWGVVQYIQGADSDEKRKTGQQHILWGLIGLVILFGANTLITIIGNIANQLF